MDKEDLKYTINEKDFEGLTKEETIENLKNLWERTKIELIRFEGTEKERLSLLNENIFLKKELGKLYAIKNLMERAEVYGYEDLLPKEIKDKINSFE